jgi:hypothetical protein
MRDLDWEKKHHRLEKTLYVMVVERELNSKKLMISGKLLMNRILLEKVYYKVGSLHFGVAKCSGAKLTFLFVGPHL